MMLRELLAVCAFLRACVSWIARLPRGAVALWNVYRYTHVPDLELSRAYEIVDDAPNPPIVRRVPGSLAGDYRTPDAGSRLELRYKRKGHKARKIVRPGESWDLASERPRRFCPRVVRASLVPRDLDTHETLDVTSRVQKYMGPHGDFAGVTSAHDMFPKEYNTEYACVTALDTAFRVRRFDFNPKTPGAADS